MHIERLGIYSSVCNLALFIPALLEILSRLLTLSEPMVTVTISALDGTLIPGLLQNCSYCIVSFSTGGCPVFKFIPSLQLVCCSYGLQECLKCLVHHHKSLLEVSVSPVSWFTVTCLWLGMGTFCSTLSPINSPTFIFFP